MRSSQRYMGSLGGVVGLPLSSLAFLLECYRPLGLSALRIWIISARFWILRATACDWIRAFHSAYCGCIDPALRLRVSSRRKGATANQIQLI